MIVSHGMGATKSGADEMGARIVIHIGPQKTGTKSLQASLQQKRLLLESDGWTMPSPSLFHGSWDISKLYDGKAKPDRTVRKVWADLIAHVRNATTRALLSCEHFSTLKDEGIAQLASDLNHIPTRIVIVYRPFYDWIASVYRQLKNGARKKHPFTPTFADWLFEPRFGNVTELESRIRGFTTSVYSRWLPHFPDVKVHELGPDLMTNVACDDLNATRTCAAFYQAQMVEAHVSHREPTSGECLSPLLLRQLENISMSLHQEMFGLFSSFPTSDFNAMSLDCFGN